MPRNHLRGTKAQGFADIRLRDTVAVFGHEVRGLGFKGPRPSSREMELGVCRSSPALHKHAMGLEGSGFKARASFRVFS